jgi:hypothetical protein
LSAQEKDAETSAYNHLALVRLDPADAASVNPSVLFWGGPQAAIAPLPAFNGVGDLGKEIAYAKAYGFGGLAPAEGTEKFSPAL